MRTFGLPLLVGLVLLSRDAPAAANSAASPAAVGTLTATFTGRTLDGRAVHPSDFAGKVLVLNFWATWCPPCRAETADLISSFKSLAGPRVAFLGVDTTESADVVKSFVTLKGVKYPTALAGPEAYNRFGIAYIPTTIVVDAQGVVRARWTGGVTPEQLRAYVENAKAGKDGVFISAEQKKIDALVEPAQFAFAGATASVSSAIAAATTALHAADAYTDKLDARAGGRYDFERTAHEKGALRVAAGTALARIATSDEQRARAGRLLGEGYAELNRWDQAAALYRAALARSPRDPKVAAALTRAYYRLHNYPAMVDVARRWVALDAKNGEAFSWLGLGEQRSRHFAAAAPAYAHSIALLEITARREVIGKDGDAVANVADTALDLANVYVSLGERAAAKSAFALAKSYAKLIPRSGANAALRERVAERTIEGMTAVALRRGARPTLTVARWTGADLPGSLKTSFRFRVVVAAPPGRSLTLSTSAIPQGWVAAFCAHGLCSPRRVSFVVPETGLETYEFQLIPPRAAAKPGPVRINASGATPVTIW